MKPFLLLICTITTLLSCTKYENEVKNKVVAPQSPIMYKMKSYQLFDSITQKRIIEFTKHIYNNQQSIPECKLVWETIPNTGEISFNDVAVVAADSCEWYYLLPVKRENNLTGIVLISIQDGYNAKGKKLQINLNLDRHVSKPRLVTSSDADFHKFSTSYEDYKKTVNPVREILYTTKAGYGEYFGYYYNLSYSSYTDSDGSIVVTADSGGLRRLLDYYRIVCGVKYEVSSFNLEYFTLYFTYTDYASGFEQLQNFAYEFGGLLSQTLWNEGYSITVTPLFNAPGFDNGGGNNDETSSGGTGGTGSSSDGDGDGDNTNNNNTGTGNGGHPENLLYLHGNADYYLKRYDDAKIRLKNINPPDYYIKYGNKYYEEFNKLKPKLSNKGKEWVDKTARLLHEAMTELLANNPDIERNKDAFRAAAFETHADAYINGGILELSLIEKMQIFFTVDIEDLLKPEGRSQVWDVGKAQVQRWEEITGEGILEGLDFMNNYELIREQVKVIVSLPPHTLSKSATVEYSDEEIDGIILMVYREQIEHFYANVPGFILPIN